MTDKELMQMALDALEDVADDAEESHKTVAAIEAIRARLAQPNEFNPDWDAVAVMVEEQQRMAKELKTQREWKGLTDEEIQEMWSDHCKNWQRAGKILISPTVFGNAIEAKLKEKNT